MMKTVTCQIVCEKQLDVKESNTFIERIEQDYTLHMLVAVVTSTHIIP